MDVNSRIRNWYLHQIEDFQQRSLLSQEKSNHISVLRLVVFLVFIALLTLSIYLQSGISLTFTVVITTIIFGKLIQSHNKVKASKKHFDLLMGMNQEEINRLELRLHDFPDGARFIDPEHPYCLDLDLFGSHSLYQLINRTVTEGGAEFLASKMLNFDSEDSLAQRQEAVKELSEHPEWCQDFLASGLAHKGTPGSITRLIDWVLTHTEYPTWYLWVLAVLPLLTVCATVAYFLGLLSGYPALTLLMFNGLILYQVKLQIEFVYHETHKSIQTLRSYEAMISRIEDSSFNSPLLRGLCKSFNDGPEKASSTISGLKTILTRVETRQNAFYWIFNIFLLLDIIWLYQAKKWKDKHHEYIKTWFQSISSYEMLISLGLTAHNQNKFTYPCLNEDRYSLSTMELGHPLIPPSERVTNDFLIKNRGTVVVLTGSNMSGKSTFLRTIGINVVMARMGAPVCAADMKLGNFNLFTSMRTTDSLEQHISSFYAELRRIRFLIEKLDEEIPILFLLDELLKGTNSMDRRAGSRALIRQLRKATSFGLISTHDLELGALSEQFDNVLNMSFNSELKDGALLFDYKLHQGLCRSFNASELMTQMGIDLESGRSEQ